MKLTILLLFSIMMQAGAVSFAQKISLSQRNAPLARIFDQISDQTGFDFLVSADMLKEAKPVTINVNKVELHLVLQQIFEKQPFQYTVDNRAIVISRKEKSAFQKIADFLTPPIRVNGTVYDGLTPLAGVSVMVKGSHKGTVTSVNGEFSLGELNEADVLVFRYIGYEDQELAVSDAKGERTVVKLQISQKKLDEVQVLGYGQKVSERISTSSIAKVTADDIARQPVTNVLQALSGRVPGVLITENSGTPGGGINVQIRANGSITAGTNPLYIIDGVPFLSEPVYTAGGNTGTNLKPSFGNSPLNAINPSDIESLQILKDADATAIYGSRGANGVVLITTKKGKAGDTKMDVNVSGGVSSVASLHGISNLTLDQYLTIRRAAYANSGATPTASLAPDLLTWSQTESTDFQNTFFGKTARFQDASASFSGGSAQMSFLLSGNYHHETTVIPGDYDYTRGAVHFNVEHSSLNRKFTATVSATMTFDKNSNVAKFGTTSDLANNAFTLAPNFPLYDASGQNLYWFNLNTFALYFENPLKYLYQNYTAKTNNLIGNINLKYTPVQGLNIRLNSGYNKYLTDAQNLVYSASLNPASGSKPYAYFQQNYTETWNLEPQMDYTRKISRGTLNLLAGATLQQTRYVQPFYTAASQYSSDALLTSTLGAGTIYTANFSSDYNYSSFFGRLNYNWLDKYILNVNYRRDGSSKFGSNNRFGDFASVGGAWIFTEEPFLKDKQTLLSYGKLRGSYGTSGNDQIGNYQYLDTYSATFYGYNGTAGLIPSKIANPNLKWEVNRKLELALDLGFLKDRILLSSSFFLNRTGNPLVTYPLSTVTGFASYYANMPATIEQRGAEFSLTTQNFRNSTFKWNTVLNLTLAKNKLVSFDNIANSPYLNTLVVGESLNTIYGYQYTGVSAATSLPSFRDVNNNGTTSLQTEQGIAQNGQGDWVKIGNTIPHLYGSISNSFEYKGFQLDILMQLVGHYKKWGVGYSGYSGTAPPGYTPVNTYSGIWDLFQETNGQIATRTFGINTDGTAYSSYDKYALSDAVVSDGAFMRLKNVSLSYRFPKAWSSRLKMSSAQVFLQGQNLLTVSGYAGYDPETAATNIPPLRTIVAGARFSF
ncbi:SusC/RagA family TonB-linked outer membrane protein [Pedobacter jeongneungensis]|uniref:SusC/RagA family TonB-linked outer membrane protein n=1 Tax=Pedobacter jeongneungensis TaxID=947309 RepID=UPI0013B45941|nr:SusC/RagA family TonB-linked outer membrane protein [Pedobacter jeongneungensis]